MDVTNPYEFIRFGAMDVTKPYEFIGFGVTKPYDFIRFGAMDVSRNDEGAGPGQGAAQTPKNDPQKSSQTAFRYPGLLAIKQLRKMFMSVLVFAVLIKFLAKVGPCGIESHRRPPSFWMVLQPPGAAQTPKMTDFQSNHLSPIG